MNMKRLVLPALVLAALVAGAFFYFDRHDAPPAAVGTDLPQGQAADPPGDTRPAPPPDDRAIELPTWSIAGLVRFTNGEPVTHQQVRCYRIELSAQQREEDRYWGDLPAAYTTANTDAQGAFKLPGLVQDGTYIVRVSGSEIGIQQQLARPGDRLAFEFEIPAIITGRVTVSSGEVPGSFRVQSRRADTFRGGMIADPFDDHICTARFTGTDGRFRIAARPGKVELTVYAYGWAEASLGPIEVPAHGASVEVPLRQLATLSGEVRTETGTAVRGAGISLHQGEPDAPWRMGIVPWDFGYPENQDDAPEVYSPGSTRGSATSDIEGRYQVPALLPGPYTLTVSYGRMQQEHQITLVEGANTASFEFPPVNILVVTVKDSAGQPVESAHIRIVREEGSGAPLRPDRHDPGVFTFPGIEEGSCRVAVSHKGFATVSIGVEITAGQNEVEVTLVRSADLTGRVKSPLGRVPEGAVLRFTSELDAGKEYHELTFPAGRYIDLAGGGEYRAPGLAQGNCTATVGYPGEEPILVQEVEIKAGAQELDLVVPDLCTLTFNVEVAPEWDHEDGVRVSVSVDRRGGSVSRSTQLVFGQAEIPFLHPGDYRVTVSSRAGRDAWITSSVTLVPGLNDVSIKFGPPNCVKVTGVHEGQGKEAGIKPGDLIIEYNGVAIDNMTALVEAVQATNEEDSVSMVVVRDGRTLSFRLSGGRIGINGDNHRR
jgi:hypothetical protein